MGWGAEYEMTEHQIDECFRDLRTRMKQVVSDRAARD
jgi:hypothetical protein